MKSDIQTLMDNQQRLLQLLNETSTYHLHHLHHLVMVRKVVRNISVLHGSLGVQVKTTHTGTVVRECSVVTATTQVSRETENSTYRHAQTP